MANRPTNQAFVTDQSEANQEPTAAERLVRDIAEVSVGSAILAIRRFNILRGRLVEESPPLSSAIEAGLDAVTGAAPVAAEEIGEMLRAVEWAAPGPLGAAAATTREVAERLPDILRLSGLTSPPPRQQ